MAAARERRRAGAAQIAQARCRCDPPGAGLRAEMTKRRHHFQARRYPRAYRAQGRAVRGFPDCSDTLPDGWRIGGRLLTTRQCCQWVNHTVAKMAHIASARRKAIWGQTPVLQYSFTWKQLSAVAGVSFWNIYFKLVQGAVRAPEIVAFLKALRRHLGDRKLLIVWDRLQAHRSRLVRE
jgi:hypothetical protein